MARGEGIIGKALLYNDGRGNRNKRPAAAEEVLEPVGVKNEPGKSGQDQESKTPAGVLFVDQY